MEATQAQVLDESPEHMLGDMYRAYAARDFDSAEWQQVDDLIRLVARRGVGKAARKGYKIPGRTREELVDVVSHELLKKFFQRRLGRSSTIKNFQALIRVTVHNTSVSCLRRIKSPLAGHLEVEPPKNHQFAPPGIGDQLSFIRERLPPFQLAEFELVRDMLLCYRLATNDYPGVEALLGMVPSKLRMVVYTAAVVDINQTILELGNA